MFLKSVARNERFNLNYNCETIRQHSSAAGVACGKASATATTTAASGYTCFHIVADDTTSVVPGQTHSCPQVGASVPSIPHITTLPVCACGHVLQKYVQR